MHYFSFKALRTKEWHKIYLSLVQTESPNSQGYLENIDVATINIDCRFTDKQTLDKRREEYLDPSGYTSIAKDLNGKSHRVNYELYLIVTRKIIFTTLSIIRLNIVSGKELLKLRSSI